MTIKDIANAAGVSQTTVSHILNHKDEKISDATRQRVLRVIAESGYVPYERIRSQILSESRSVGLMLPTLNSSFYVSVASIMQKNAQERGLSLVLALTNCSAETERAALSTFISNKVSGILSFSGSAEGLSMLENYCNMGIAAVALDHVEKSARFPRIYRDSFHIAEMCTDHLLACGCQRTGLFLRNDCGRVLQETIINGYAASLQTAGIPYEQRFVLYKTPDFMNGFRALVDAGVDGIVCQDADAAATIYTAATKDHLRIPDDLSVISMEDSELAPQLFPPLTAALTDVQEMATAAFECLLAQLNKEPLPFSTKNMNVSLVMRDSIRKRKPTTSKVVVMGYINMDILLSTPHHPVENETMVATRLGNYPGGKGDNQAYGVSFLGGNAYLIGKIGADRHGRYIYDQLRHVGVNTDGVSFVEKGSTGTAYISLLPDGKSSVMIDPGVNATLNSLDIEKNASLFSDAHFCLMQTDVGADAIQAAYELCLKNKVKIIMRAAYSEIPQEILKDVFVLSLSQRTLAQLCPQFASVDEQAQSLIMRGVENIIVTEEVSGCRWISKHGIKSYPAYQYICRDGTGTNDVFLSCLAVLLAEGRTLDEAIYAANWAAAYSTTKLGIQNGIPARALLDEFMDGKIIPPVAEG